MKVLHVLQSDRFSGAENVVCQIIKMFENNPNVEMAYTSQDGQIREALHERGIKFYPMTILCHSELKNVVNEYKPDIIHGHDIRGAIESSRFAYKCRVIHTIHGNDVKMRRMSAKSFLYCMSAQKAKHVFWVSRTCLEQYKFYSFVKNKSSILYNVIDAKEVIKKRSADTNVYDYDVVFIGRLAIQKNPQRLMRVLSLVVKEMPEFSAAIVGTGDLEEAAKALSKEYDIVNNVDFHGFMGNPYKVLSDSKILVMTSDWEGTPMVALEALSLGKPIVSTPTDGMCDIIQNGINGFCEKDEKEIANRIIQLLTDKEMYTSFCNAQLRRNIEINDVDKYKEEIEIAYSIQ